MYKFDFLFNRLRYQRKTKTYMELQTNLKDTSEKYGKLYGFFLEVCRRFIDDEIHNEIGLPEDGEEMYNYLEEQLESWFEEPYGEIIYGFDFLSKKEKQLLVPRDRIIKVANLDYGIYFKIISFIGGELRYNKLGQYMARVRNYICHVPVVSLRKEKSQYEFDGDVLQMGLDFQDAGISKTLLDECEMSIFNRITRR